MKTCLKLFAGFLLANVVIGIFTVIFVDHAVRADWRTASREPVGLAPDPADHPEAIVQVYGARAYSWRGIFAVHTWISVKPENASYYTSLEVIGWRVRHGGQSVSASRRPADSRWFGAVPEIYTDIRGEEAAALIPRIIEAAENYPYMDKYTVWPGPNSNTFTAHVARQVPEMRLELPPTAIGKDFIPGNIIGLTPSGRGAQVSLFGLAGVMAGIEEGVEVNILGLSFGLDPLDLAIKLPLAGRFSALD